MKKWLAVLLLMMMCLSAQGCGKGEKPYVASSLRAPFHLRSCQWAGRIDPDHRQEYATKEEAVKAGHRACKVCQP